MAEPHPGQSEEAKEAEGDEELQQLIAQAAESLANTSSLKKERVAAIQQALERLLAALNQRSTLMESGQITETGQVDQQIATQTENLQSAVSEVLPETQGFTPPEAAPANPGQGNLLQSLSSYFDLAFGFIQKIQEIRSTFRQVQEDSVNEAQQATQATQPETPSEPVVEQAGEVTGAVTEDGVPVEGATVSDPDSGVSATTDANGAFNLPGIPAGMVNLKVLKDSLQLAQGRVSVRSGRAAIADFQLQPRAKTGPSGAAPAVRIIPSVVAVKTATPGRDVGNLKGVVADLQGRPIPRALVSIRGLAVARTDSQGRYTFTRVPPGLHQMTVFRDGAKIESK